MKKSIFSFMFALALVLSCAGVCFADSGTIEDTIYFVDANTQVIYDSTGFIIQSSGRDAQGLITTYSCTQGTFVCNFTREGSVMNNLPLVTVNSSTGRAYTNLSGCTQDGNSIRANATSGSFTLTVNSPSGLSINFYDTHNYTTGLVGSTHFDFSSYEFNGVEYANPIVAEVFDFSLQPGYALVIDGQCEILERSYYINNSWDFTKNGNMRVNGAFENDLSSTYIRDGYSPDLSYSRDDLIQWEALNANIVGSASNYESYDGTLVEITQGETYVIGYPQLYGFGTSNSRLLYTNSVDLVGHVYIQYSQRPTFRFVALESLSEFSNTGDFYTYSVFRPAVADVTGDVTSGSGGDVVTPSTSLPSGGGNAGQPPVDEDGSLLGTISRFVNDIKRLLSSAVEAINTLVNDGSSFMQSIGTMFTWLPAPLSMLIIAGFTILLVVGVLKTLWR